MGRGTALLAAERAAESFSLGGKDEKVSDCGRSGWSRVDVAEGSESTMEPEVRARQYRWMRPRSTDRWG
jgi:hypothetical protein